MVPATVTPSVLMTSSGSMARQTVRIGLAAITTSMLGWVTTGPAASSSTSGRRTLRAAPTPTIPAILRASTDVRGWSAGTTSRTTGLTGSVTRTAATTTTGGRGTRPTSGPRPTSPWTPAGPWYGLRRNIRKYFS